MNLRITSARFASLPEIISFNRFIKNKKNTQVPAHVMKLSKEQEIKWSKKLSQGCETYTSRFNSQCDFLDQPLIKYSLFGKPWNKFAKPDFLVVMKNKILIYEAKLTHSGIKDDQKFLYVSLLQHMFPGYEIVFRYIIGNNIVKDELPKPFTPADDGMPKLIIRKK